MDIHKPKPVHSFREFLSEIAVVVCGIAIALTGEQVIEAMHRNTEVREAREALAQEIEQDAQRLSLSTEATACQERQLDAYAAWAQGGAKPPAYRSFLPLLRTGTWDTVKAVAVIHMPLKERVALAAFYDQLENFLKNRDHEGAATDAVVSFGDLKTLGPGDRVELLKAVAVARRAVDVIHSTASRTVDVAKALGYPTGAPTPLPPVVRSGVDWACGRPSPDPYRNGG